MVHSDHPRISEVIAQRLSNGSLGECGLRPGGASSGNMRDTHTTMADHGPIPWMLGLDA